MQSTEKTVLIIAGDCPPKAMTSSKRPALLAKYIAKYGWKPVVLSGLWTPENCSYDPNYVPGFPGKIPVFRVPVVDPVSGTLGNIRSLLRRSLLPHRIPVIYLEEGKKALIDIFNQYSIDIIWATAPPASVHVLAEWAARKWEKPWVADFRDIINQQYISIITSIVVPVRLFYERRYLHTADGITTVSQGLADIFTKRYRRGVEVLSHGFDPRDINPDNQKVLQNFTIVFTGSVQHGPGPNFRPLLDAVEKLIREGVMNPEEISIEFYGDGNEDRLQCNFNGHSCFYLVNIFPGVSWSDCRRIQRSAAVLLQNTVPGKKGLISSKIYEYLAAQRPILATPADGDCIDELLRETGTGFSCTTVEEIAGQILSWYREWQETGTTSTNINQEAVMKYSREKQARALARILDRIIEGGE